MTTAPEKHQDSITTSDQPMHLAVSHWCCSYVPGCVLETVIVDSDDDPFLNWTTKEPEVTCQGCLDFIKGCDDLADELKAFEAENEEQDLPFLKWPAAASTND